MKCDWNEIEAALEAVAGPGYALDRERIEAFATGIARGRLSADANRLAGALVRAGPDDVDRLAALTPVQREEIDILINRVRFHELQGDWGCATVLWEGQEDLGASDPARPDKVYVL